MEFENYTLPSSVVGNFSFCVECTSRPTFYSSSLSYNRSYPRIGIARRSLNSRPVSIIGVNSSKKKKRGEDFSSIFPKIDEMGGERGIHLSLGGLPFSITFSILLHALLI